MTPEQQRIENELRARVAWQSAAAARRIAEDLSRAAAAAAELADAAVWQATRHAPGPTVAQALGVSLAAVRKAVQQHNRRQKGLPASAESDRRRRANQASAA